MSGLSRGAKADVRRVALTLSCNANGESTLVIRTVDSGGTPPPNPALRSRDGPIRPTETIAEAATGAWMKLPQLVSDGESKCAVYVEGETQSAILCASIETLGRVSVTSESGAGVGWPRFEGSFYLGNGFAPLQWDSEAGVYKAQTTMTFSNLD